MIQGLLPPWAAESSTGTTEGMCRQNQLSTWSVSAGGPCGPQVAMLHPPRARHLPRSAVSIQPTLLRPQRPLLKFGLQLLGIIIGLEGVAGTVQIGTKPKASFD